MNLSLVFVCSRNNFPKIKDGAHIVNIDNYKSVGTNWIALDINVDKVTYFDNFGAEHIPKENKKFKANKKITANIYRVQTNNLFICGYLSWI